MMNESTSEYIRRKHCSIDLQQLVVRLDVYKRPLKANGGKSGYVIGLSHEAAVATTSNGRLYLIEKGVDKNEDINFPAGYREKECRIVEVSRREIRDWQIIKSVTEVVGGVPLEDLFDSCGNDYGFFTDNCWNGALRMRTRANPAEDELTWQAKGAIVGLVAGVAAIGIGVLAKSLTSAEEEKKKKQKY